jgi:hypothetical protein
MTPARVRIPDAPVSWGPALAKFRVIGLQSKAIRPERTVKAKSPEHDSEIALGVRLVVVILNLAI